MLPTRSEPHDQHEVQQPWIRLGRRSSGLVPAPRCRRSMKPIVTMPLALARGLRLPLHVTTTHSKLALNLRPPYLDAGRSSHK